MHENFKRTYSLDLKKNYSLYACVEQHPLQASVMKNASTLREPHGSHQPELVF